MAVRLLYGPALITNDIGELTEYPTLFELDTWWPNVGGIATKAMFPSGEQLGAGVITLDGVFCERTPYISQNFNWWPSRGKMVQRDVYLGEAVVDPKIFSRQAVHPDDQVESGTFVQRYVKLQGRRIFGTSGGIRSATGSFSGDYVVEGPNWATEYDMGNPSLYPGRADHEVLVSGVDLLSEGNSNAVAIFYDLNTQDVSSPKYYFGINVTGNAVYAPEFGVFVTVQVEEFGASADMCTIRVWSLEVYPTELTEIELIDGTVQSGSIVTYRTQLLGADGDPAPGELVNWLVAGAGVMVDAQSTTDDDGYAIAQVAYAIGEVGDSVVTASVRC